MSTLRQQLAVKKVLENNGNVSKAMKEAGYPETTASNPQQLTRSKGWQELMEKYLPDEKIIKKINEGLEATRVISAIKGTSANGGTTDFIDVPDYMARHKYVETSLKIKGRLDSVGEDPPSIIFNFYGNRLRPSNQSSSQTESST